MNTYVVYDVETYPNVFTCVLRNAGNPDQLAVYEISERVNDVDRLARSFRKMAKNDVVLVGFNSINFEWIEYVQGV